MMQKAKADWSVELWTECPYCEEYQEIEFESIDEYWIVLGSFCHSSKDINHKHKCEECGKEFLITETVW